MNNAFKYVKVLIDAGVNRDQAEAHVQIISDFLELELATKQDLNNSVERLDNKINQLDTKIDNAVAHLENKMLQLEYRMTIKLGSIITLAIAAVATIVKLI